MNTKMIKMKDLEVVIGLRVDTVGYESDLWKISLKVSEQSTWWYQVYHKLNFSGERISKPMEDKLTYVRLNLKKDLDPTLTIDVIMFLLEEILNTEDPFVPENIKQVVHNRYTAVQSLKNLFDDYGDDYNFLHKDHITNKSFSKRLSDELKIRVFSKSEPYCSQYVIALKFSCDDRLLQLSRKYNLKNLYKMSKSEVLNELIDMVDECNQKNQIDGLSEILEKFKAFCVEESAWR